MQHEGELLAFVKACLKKESRPERSRTIAALGMSKRTVWKIETGEINDPGSSKVEKLARYFGAKISIPEY